MRDCRRISGFVGKEEQSVREPLLSFRVPAAAESMQLELCERSLSCPQLMRFECDLRFVAGALRVSLIRKFAE